MTNRDERPAGADQTRRAEDEETHGRNRHGTMDAGHKGGTKGSNFENSGPNETAPPAQTAENAGGMDNPNLSAEQDTETGRM